MQRVWTEHTCPFSPFSLVKHSPSGGMYGRKSFAKSRAHYGGWRFISMQGDRSPKVYNDPTAAMSILQSNHSSATSADSSGSVASACCLCLLSLPPLSLSLALTLHALSETSEREMVARQSQLRKAMLELRLQKLLN